MLSAARIDKLIWVLIYGGLFAIGLGLAVRPADAALRWVLFAGGGLLVLAGAALVWVRSRMKDGA